MVYLNIYSLGFRLEKIRICFSRETICAKYSFFSEYLIVIDSCILLLKNHSTVLIFQSPNPTYRFQGAVDRNVKPVPKHLKLLIPMDSNQTLISEINQRIN